MSQTKENNSKILKLEDIISFEESSKLVVLPSGQNVLIKYISLGMVSEIFDLIKDISENEKPINFSKKTVEFMLRENEHNDYLKFSEDDQDILIESAAEMWGCLEEYNELSILDLPINRFYKAAVEKRNKLYKQIAVNMKPILDTVTSTMVDTFNLNEVYQKALIKMTKPLLEAIDVSSIAKNVLSNSLINVIDTFNSHNFLKGVRIGDFDKFYSIGQMISPLNKVIEELSKPVHSFMGESIRKSTNLLFESFEDLMKNNIKFEKFYILPDVIRYYPAIEMHNTSIMIGELSGERDFEDDSYSIIVPENNKIVIWLENLDPDFAKMLIGAKQTINSNNLDKFRHFTTSNRELFSNLLRLFAPNEKVKIWVDRPEQSHNGKPTRRARLSYITRNYSDESFKDFFIKDGKNLIDLLNADLHKKGHQYTKEQMYYLHNRFLSFLGFLMEIILHDENNY